MALPKYLDETVHELIKSMDGPVVDLEAVFHELTTQLMGRMAYDVRTSITWEPHVLTVLDGCPQYGSVFDVV